jgi:hypothetical protein
MHRYSLNIHEKIRTKTKELFFENAGAKIIRKLKAVEGLGIYIEMAY